MSTPALAGAERPALRIGRTSYPVLLPSVRDARLHLAAVIISLQILGQVALDFSLSIAQILIAIGTCAVLEVGIAFWRQRVVLWPASALLTGNGVAFVLRVPGTEHGDWWSTNGAWIFAATSAVAILSKYVIRFRGRHVFNPSNLGLVLCFLLLGSARAEPLALWWGPLSPGLVLALTLIVAGGFSILRRLRLLSIAVLFWLVFAAAIGVLAASGHEMTAPWRLEPIGGIAFWWLLVTSPEILVFLFFMITDPRTVPDTRGGRRAYAVAIALLATLLIAPQSTEYATKVAVLGALAIVCGLRPPLLAASSRRVGAAAHGLVASHGGTARFAVAGVVGAALLAGAIVLAGIPARPADTAGARAAGGDLPTVTTTTAEGLSPIDRATSRRIAMDVVADLRLEADALELRSRATARRAATGPWLAELWRRIAARPGPVPIYTVDRMGVALRPAGGQAPPMVVATLSGTWRTTSSEPRPFTRTVELARERGRYLISVSRGGAPALTAAVAAPAGALNGVRLDDAAAALGIDFTNGAYRFGASRDTPTMMGGAVCWLDADNDGWLDLYVTNTYSYEHFATWEERGSLPRAALYRNVGGRFVDASRGSGADLPLRASGCAASDLDGDGNVDLLVTSTGFNVPTEGYDALLWGNGDGTFTEGARAAGLTAAGWHGAATVGDVNGDGRQDVFVAGYTNPAVDVPSIKGFPSNHAAVRDLLYLNVGPGQDGHARFREVGRAAGIERAAVEHGLGAVLVDLDGDDRLDLFVANDTDPNRMYLNRPASGPLGFRFVERAAAAGVADPNAGMGIAVEDFSGDDKPDLLVTNARGQLHAAHASTTGLRYVDARPSFARAFVASLTGWGTELADLDDDGDLDVVVANGAIPVTRPARTAERVQVLANVAQPGAAGTWVDASAQAGLDALRPVNGRGLATADFDNDGDLDVAIATLVGRPLLLRNTGAAGGWLVVRSPDAIPGTVITVTLSNGRRLVRHVRAGGSYLSSGDPRTHFGLGGATVRRVVMRFPSGDVRRVESPRANRILDVAR